MNIHKLRSLIPEFAQVGGLAAITGGVWVLAGFGWALVAFGVIAATVGAALEARAI